MKWMISEDRLGSDQNEVIDEIGKISAKSIWIQGHAGSGKSVLLLHALKDYLVRKPNAKICVVVFTRALVDLLTIGLKQIPALDTFLKKGRIPVYTIYEVNWKLGNNEKFDAIFCDEVQDIPLSIIESMKNSSTHLIIAGDANQSIYTTVPGLNLVPAKPEEIVSEIKPIEKKLKTIYRLTESVIGMIKNVFSNIFSEKSIIGKQNTEILVYKGQDEKQEIEFCWKTLEDANRVKTSSVIAILLYKHDKIVQFINEVLILNGKPIWVRIDRNNSPRYDLCNSHLEQQGIPIMYIGNDYGSLEKADKEHKIIIMTYHSAKGLDFDYVCLPLVGSDMWLSPINALLLVALSRSKNELIVSYTKQMYDPLKTFLKDIPVRNIPTEEDDENDFLF